MGYQLLSKGDVFSLFSAFKNPRKIKNPYLPFPCLTRENFSSALLRPNHGDSFQSKSNEKKKESKGGEGAKRERALSSVTEQTKGFYLDFPSKRGDDVVLTVLRDKYNNKKFYYSPGNGLSFVLLRFYILFLFLSTS